MSVSSLITACSVWDWLPIDIENHVRPEFLKLGVKDQVYFWPDPKLNPEIMRGEIEHWEYDEWSMRTEPVRVADITYSQQMPHDWQRLVCCKELLHILDPVHTRVTKPEEIEKLVEKIVLPSDLQDVFNDGIHALTDRVAITYAAAVLFPLAARQILLDRYSEGKLKIAEIAKIAELPPRYAAVVMSELWPSIHAILVA